MKLEMKWKRSRQGRLELWEGDMLHGFCEKSSHRSCWWWTTWGRRGGDVGGFVYSQAVAKASVTTSLSTEDNGSGNGRF